MSKLTRLQACKTIRRDTLVTLVQGDQLIGTDVHEFTVMPLYDRRTKELYAVFRSTHSIYHYKVKVQWKQLLHFIKRFYPRHLNEEAVQT